MIDQKHLKDVSEQTLENFEAIASVAEKKLKEGSVSGGETLIPSNTFPDRKPMAQQNWSAISAANMSGYMELAREPAICRVMAVDEGGACHIYYIARKTSIPLQNGSKLASYLSPVGRLASLNVGDKITIQIAGKPKDFELLEKIEYRPRCKDGVWDSWNTELVGEDYGPVTIESLQALLRGYDRREDAEALLNAMLEGAPQDNVLEGLRHEVRRSMALRDQPILDRFQDEIFRLPINSQLLILGPPGTGKTTTLIRRLGQKIDSAALSEEESALLSRIARPVLPHDQSWVMFTPTELLKHFVKEAFNREQIPASNDRIKTWDIQRNEIARNALGILQSPNSKGKFVLKASNHHLRPEVEQYPMAWFDAFEAFHRQRILDQFMHGMMILEPLQQYAGAELVGALADIMSKADASRLMSVYRALDGLEERLVPVVKRLKDESDRKIKMGLVKSLEQNRQFVRELADYIDTLQEEDEADEDEEFDDDTGDDTEQQPTSLQKAVQVYNRCIRTLARSKILTRSVRKESTADRVRQWLGAARLPSDEELRAIGESIAAQNGLRRFVHASRRLILDIPASYRQFRREALKARDWYEGPPQQPRHVDAMELDALLLLTLKMARDLLGQTHVARNGVEPKFAFLQPITDRLYNQVLVDEATDFSPLQLACMASLTRLETGSFFACGDFNQRITQWGTRRQEQVRWAVDRMSTRTITTVYRQSQSLNDFSTKLLEILGGDLESRGQLPEHLHHVGVPPVLLEDTTALEDVAIWLTERIQEVEKIVNIGHLPTIAVLVNAEEHVKPMADALNQLLEDINLRAVACFKGQSLGVGSDVRVFSVEHIKGLEFEAVFFIGIDELAEQLPELFGKFLYVGATRAATYLGLTCKAALPSAISVMRNAFVRAWC